MEKNELNTQITVNVSRVRVNRVSRARITASMVRVKVNIGRW